MAHVLRTANALDAAHVVAVVRHERDQVAAEVEAVMPGIIVVDQDEIPGTGRAVEQALAALPDGFEGEVLVLNGDVPLLDADTLAGLLEQHRGHAAAGIRALGDRTTTRPATDASCATPTAGSTASSSRRTRPTTSARSTRSTRASTRSAPEPCATSSRNLTTDNAQGEKYLTDVIQLLREAGSEVEAVPVSEPWLVAGINDRAQLSETAARLNALIVRGWQLNGVTIEDPATTWIDLDVTIAPDVTIRPGTQLKGATVIATGASSGPTRRSSTARSARRRGEAHGCHARR